MPSAELERAIAAQREFKALLDGATSLDEVRNLDETEVAKWSGPLDADVRTEAVDADGVPCEWVIPPDADDDRVFVYLHGGGFVLGSIETIRTPVSRVARRANARGLLPVYRLAPEHLYPAHVEDIVTVYKWLLAQGVPAGGIVIAGESAGGGLVVATLQAIRDAGLPAPGAAVPISPMVDFEFKGATWETNAALDGFVDKALAQQNVPVFLGEGRDPGEASPINQDLSGLPPLLVQVGGSECILDDARALAAKAEQAGVEVTLEEWPEMVHLWHNFSFLPDAIDALDRIGAFVEQQTAAATSRA